LGRLGRRRPGNEVERHPDAVTFQDDADADAVVRADDVLVVAR
jgi:hypothetical protein